MVAEPPPEAAIWKLRAIARRVCNGLPFSDDCLALSLEEFAVLTADQVENLLNTMAPAPDRGAFRRVARSRFIHPADGEAFHFGYYPESGESCKFMIGYQPTNTRYDCKAPPAK